MRFFYQFSGLKAATLLTLLGLSSASAVQAQLGVGAKPPKGAEVLFDGSRKLLDEKWTYWEGPRLAATLPIKWHIEKDPAGKGTILNSNDPAAVGGKYGAADIVTKEAFRDFRLHVEFYISKPGGNSGVYLQNRYEIQIFDGDTTSHGLGAVINESPSPYHLYTGMLLQTMYEIKLNGLEYLLAGIR